jgi:hypothetical protein
VLTVVGCGDWRARVRQDAAKLQAVEIHLAGANLGQLKQRLSALPLDIRQPHNRKIPPQNLSVANWGESGIVEATFPVLASELSDATAASSIQVNSEFPGTLCGERTRTVLASKTACGSPIHIRRNDSGRVDIIWNR